MPSASPATPVPPGNKPKRRLRRLALIFLLGVLILLPLLNGPIFRKVVDSQLDKVFHDLYLKGDFKVTGTILGGIELKDVDLKGSRNLQSLTLAKAKVNYRISPLIKGNWGEAITMLHLSDMEIFSIRRKTSRPILISKLVRRRNRTRR